MMETESYSISDALIDLAAPLFHGRHGAALPDDELEFGLALARLAWNAILLDDSPEVLQETYDILENHLGSEEWARTRPIFDQMVAERRARFGSNRRVVVTIDIVHLPDGERRLDVATAALKPSRTGGGAGAG